MNPLDNVTTAVAALEDALPALLEACTDPQAADMAELFVTVQEARTKLLELERTVEGALGKALAEDMTVAAGLRIERSRSSERKAWDHEGWQRDVRQNLMRQHGLLRATVFDANGNELEAGVLHGLLRDLQGMHGAAGPKVTALRAIGLDARDYCETSPGRVTVKVHRLADETEGGSDDAAA